MRRGILATAIFALIGLAILINLGVWQLRRLPVKQAEIARIEAMIHDAPVALPLSPDPIDDEYQPVLLAGEILDGEIHVLVSTRDYGAGFRIITPFKTDTGRVVMLDRGYVRTQDKTTPRQIGPMQIIGNLHWPEERTGSIPDDDPDKNFWYARDVAKMAAHLGTEEILVVAREGTSPDIQPLPVDSKNIPNSHLSYAIQWFLFALVWFGMTSALLWRMRAKPDQTGN